jgi:hypothetical protein
MTILVQTPLIGRYGGVGKNVPPWLKAFDSGIQDKTSPPAITVLDRLTPSNGLIDPSEIDFERTDLFIYVVENYARWNNAWSGGQTRNYIESYTRAQIGGGGAITVPTNIELFNFVAGVCPNEQIRISSIVRKVPFRIGGLAGYTTLLQYSWAGTGSAGTLCGSAGNRGKSRIAGYYETRDKPT